MHIDILHFIEGAKKAKGLTVIIDVFRAFSVDCYIFKNGADKIIPVNDINEAYKLKKENPEFILIGERNERKPAGFDYGNSPDEIKNVDFTGKTIIQTTGAGTQGIANAKNADEIITGSFVNASAVVNYIKKRNPDHLSLVAMGYAGTQPADEDYYCALHIKNTLSGIPTDFDNTIEILKKGSGKRFFLPENQWHSPSADFYMCLNLDAVNFVIKAFPYKKGLVYLTKIK